MMKSIHTISDVETFFSYLLHEESLNFHPDEDFKNYINLETALPSYSPEEAELRNSIMICCFEICENEGVEIYDIGLQLLFARLK